MAERIAAEEFDLKPRTQVELQAENHYVVVIDRKSRLIMADGCKIAENAEKIRKAKRLTTNKHPAADSEQRETSS